MSISLKMFGALKRLWPKLKPNASRSVATSVVRSAFPKAFYDMLRLQPDDKYTSLSNGLVVATEERPATNFVCVGLFIDGGARYEASFENGIAHFFEHVAFKSTHARSRHDLECQMSATGARFKCFTTRELCGYYVECLAEDIIIVVDMLADCVFNNKLDCDEIEAEKRIVYKEMVEQEQDTTDVLFDYLHRAAYFGTPLAQTVMGSSANLHNFCRETIGDYIDNTFDPTRTVLAAVGGVSHEQLLDLAQLYLLRAANPPKSREDSYRFTAGDFRFRDDSLPLCNLAIAFEAPSLCSEDHYVLDVARMHIGGWDRSQPAGIQNANKLARAASSGLCEAFRAFNIKYKDCGLWGVQMMCSRNNIEDFMYNVQNELMNLCLMITDNEVAKAKEEVKTRLLTRTESPTGSCMDLGKYTLYKGKRPPLHERLCGVENVIAMDVQEMCTQLLYDRDMCVAAVGPCEQLPAYPRLRAGQYWLRA